jgi:hypothetical protein
VNKEDAKEFCVQQMCWLQLLDRLEENARLMVQEAAADDEETEEWKEVQAKACPELRRETWRWRNLLPKNLLLVLRSATPVVDPRVADTRPDQAQRLLWIRRDDARFTRVVQPDTSEKYHLNTVELLGCIGTQLDILRQTKKTLHGTEQLRKEGTTRTLKLGWNYEEDHNRMSAPMPAWEGG